MKATRISEKPNVHKPLEAYVASKLEDATKKFSKIDLSILKKDKAFQKA